MIPSRYLYPVIALVLVWAGSLLGVYQYATAEEDPEGDERYQAGLIDKLEEQNFMLFESEVMAFEELLREDSKSVFRPVTSALFLNSKTENYLRRKAGSSLTPEKHFTDYDKFIVSELLLL